MKITINRRGISGEEEAISFSKFAERHNLQLEVNERSTSFRRDFRWYCSFKGLEISTPGILSSPSGNGPTIEAAMQDYANQLRGKRLVVGAYKPDRREFEAPNEWKPEDFSALLDSCK